MRISYSDYPRPMAMRTGAKVSWYTYATKKEAAQASKLARKHADQQAAMGYDFGFQAPGEIINIDSQGRANNKLWTVVIP